MVFGGVMAVVKVACTSPPGALRISAATSAPVRSTGTVLAVSSQSVNVQP